ncbi:MAG: tetratricopeptide repeat protein [Candidatus Thorarchaeota archaeon]
MCPFFRRKKEPETIEECHSEARKHIAKLIKSSSNKDLENALLYLNKGVQLDPTVIETYEMMGTVLKAVKRHNEALEVYIEALSHVHDKVRIMRSIIMNLLDAEETLDEALEWANRALEIDPQNLKVINLKAVCKHKKGLRAEALQTVDLALQIDPNDIYNLNLKGTLLMSDRKWEEAKKVEEKFLALLKPRDQYYEEMRSQSLKKIELINAMIAKESKN